MLSQCRPDIEGACLDDWDDDERNRRFSSYEENGWLILRLAFDDGTTRCEIEKIVDFPDELEDGDWLLDYEVNTGHLMVAELEDRKLNFPPPNES